MSGGRDRPGPCAANSPQAGGSLPLQAGREAAEQAWEEQAGGAVRGRGSTLTVQGYLAEPYPTCPDRFPMKTCSRNHPKLPTRDGRSKRRMQVGGRPQAS